MAALVQSVQLSAEVAVAVGLADPVHTNVPRYASSSVRSIGATSSWLDVIASTLSLRRHDPSGKPGAVVIVDVHALNVPPMLALDAAVWQAASSPPIPPPSVTSAMNASL